MSEFDFDLFVIGGGSGGVRAARIAAGHGAKVAIAEEYRFGGTCVIRGCVPKKLLVYASRFRDEFEDAAGFGWSVGDRTLRLADADRQQGRRDRAPRGPLPRRPGARRASTILQARAELADAHTRDRAARRPQDHGRARSWSRPAAARWCRRCRAPATPSPPTRPSTSRSCRSRIVIVGGGYIAVEFACIFNGLGVETTLALPRPQDPARLRRGAARRPHAGALQARHRRACATPRSPPSTRAGRSCTVTLKDGSTVETGQVMFATGRSAQHGGHRPRGGRRQARRQGRDRRRRHTRAPRSRTSMPSAT